MNKIAVIVSLIIILFFYSERSPAIDKGRRNEDIDKRVVELVNRARAKGMKCGGRYYGPARPVQWNDIIGRATLSHCLDMVKRGILCHTDYAGGRPGDMLMKSGYKWGAYGETVGEGYRTAEEMVDEWLKSPEHCKIIMNPVFKEAGSSYAWRSGKIYWTLILAAPKR